MQADHLTRPLAVVALPSPVDQGARFPRATWPAHVTLASNFAVDASAAQVTETVREVVAGLNPMAVSFEGAGMFGPSGDIPVQLMCSPAISHVHERLAEALERLPRFEPEQPAYWRAGFRPHMTHVADRDTPEGAQTVLGYVAIAVIDGEHAIIVDRFSLTP